MLAKSATGDAVETRSGAWERAHESNKFGESGVKANNFVDFPWRNPGTESVTDDASPPAVRH